MKKQLTLVLSVLLMMLTINAQKITLAKSYQDYSYPSVNSLQIDNNGNYIMAINVSRPVIFGTDTFTNKSSSFVVSIDTGGNLNWIQPVGAGWYGGDNVTTPLAICDAENRLFVLGSFTDSAYVADSLLTGTGLVTFIARLSPQGNLIWVKPIGVAFNGCSITEDRFHNLIVSGYNANTCSIDTNHLSNDIVVAKFDSVANLIWVRSDGVSDPFYTDVAQAVSTDYAGNVYAGGYCRNKLTFGNVTLGLGRDSDQLGYIGFVVKYDPSGTPLWAEPSGYWVQKIAVDSAGNSYAGGYSEGIDEFGDSTAQQVGGQGWFIAKFNTNGNLNWVRAGMTDGQAFDVALDDTGNCYVTGVTNTDFQITGYQFPQGTCTGDPEVSFVVALNPAGDILWYKIPCSSLAQGLAICTKSCQVAFAGKYTSIPLTIDSTTLPVVSGDSISNGKWSLFLMSMQTCVDTDTTVTTGVGQLPGAALSLYPSPNSGTFNLVIDGWGQAGYNLDIIDVSGKTVATRRVRNGSNDIEVPLASGFYLLDISNGQSGRFIKMVINR